MKRRGSVRLNTKTFNSKLAPVVWENGRLKPKPPYCAATYVSIRKTCPDTCSFKDNGCFVQTGLNTGRLMRILDYPTDGIEQSPRGVIEAEAEMIRSMKVKGRDLRLHVGGDVVDRFGAEVLGASARSYQKQGGGSVWTYTHRWREIRRSDWGPISVLASVESPSEVEAAKFNGYPSAIVVPQFPNGARSFRLKGSDVRFVPCPAETRRNTTCVQCRLCLDRDLHKMNAAIAFEAHGARKSSVQKALHPRLPVVR